MRSTTISGDQFPQQFPDIIYAIRLWQDTPKSELAQIPDF